MTLDEISDSIQYGYTESSTTDPIGPKFLRITDIQNGAVTWSDVPYCKIDEQLKEKYLLKDGDLVFARTGATVGKSFLIKGKIPESIFASYLIRVRVKSDVLDKFVGYFFKTHSYWSQITKGQAGIGQPNVNGTKLASLQLPLPPLPEQHRIVAKIESLFSELDKGIENLKTAQQQLKVYRQAVLKWAFEGKLTEEWRKKNRNGKSKIVQAQAGQQQSIAAEPEVSYLDRTGIELSLPEGWKWIALGEIAEVKRGKSKHRPRDAKELYGGKYPFIQTGDVKAANGGVIKTYSQTYSEIGLKQSKLWKKGTLCLTIAANIADTAFLGFDACFPDSVVGIIADEEKASLNFINYYIRKVRKEIDSTASATAQKNINVEYLDKLRVPSLPLEEQHQIISEIESRLSVCDKLETTIEENLQQAEALRQSILKKAFEGRLI